MTDRDPALSGACHIDRQLALAAVDGDEELLREIALIFVEDEPRMMEALRTAVGATAATDLASAAHAVNGSVSVFGCARATELACQLETMGRAGDLSDVASTFAELETVIGTVVEDLRRLGGEAA